MSPIGRRFACPERRLIAPLHDDFSLGQSKHSHTLSPSPKHCPCCSISPAPSRLHREHSQRSLRRHSLPPPSSSISCDSGEIGTHLPILHACILLATSQGHPDHLSLTPSTDEPRP